LAYGQSFPFGVRLWYPINGQTFLAPARIELQAVALDSNAVVTVEYFSGTTRLGTATNSGSMWPLHDLFFLVWSNVVAGDYNLTAVATDSSGIMATSPPVNISVVSLTPPSVPFVVRITRPENGQNFFAPANISLRALVVDSNLVDTVEYFSGATSLGIVTNSGGLWLTNTESHNPFSLIWSNVMTGNYTLTAVATDSSGIMATSPPVNISVVTPTPPSVPFVVRITHPENGQNFFAPANIGLHAVVVDSNLVETVEYFSGGTSLGVVTNTGGMWLTNTESHNPFSLIRSNVTTGNYTLTAVATDSSGIMATSPPVNISVVTPTPPIVPFVIRITNPADGHTYLAPPRFELHSLVVDSNLVETVEYFSGGTSLGIVTNSGGIWLTNTESHNPFSLVWSNVTAGNYTLTAVATDNAGIMATSPPVNISVIVPTPPSVPFVVRIKNPIDGQTFLAPANIGLHALVVDSNMVETVEYFSGPTSVGIVTNTAGIWLTNTESHNPFSLVWSNVLAGDYVLTAVATDSAGIMATSPPIALSVVTNLPTVVRIYAPDPVAIEGTNSFHWFGPITNTATFVIWRDGPTNADLTVQYNISGTATNGMDYATIPDSVTIVAGHRKARITILPLSDQDSSYRAYDTVLLSLTVPQVTPPPYKVGSPGKAGAIILEENVLPVQGTVIRRMPDHSLYLSLPAPDGMSFALETSPDLVNWQPVCTNTVLKGSAQFIDPNSLANSNLFYRIVPPTAQ
jgi:hypothetical protein